MSLTDPGNPENQNAGNGGDLVKHTVYLAVLDHLLRHEPWAAGLRVRECHAGRGMYEIPDDDRRRSLLDCLNDPRRTNVGVPLHDTQRESQTALNVWPSQHDNLGWYSGSAVANAWCIGNATHGKHFLELFELAPDTRSVLRALFADPGLQFSSLTVRVLPLPEDGLDFDGETHIARSIAGWTSQDLVLLDPFAMWRQPAHQARRDRYRNIIDRLLALPESPQMVLFWTWGRAHSAADGDVGGANPPVRNGYQELRQVLHDANRPFVRVCWRWGFQFAMWVVVPAAHLEALRAVLQQRCDQLRDHLLRHGCGDRLSSPNVAVTVD